MKIELPELVLPPIFDPLFQPKRYKVLYGGRLGMKSWQIARVLLTMALERKLRIMCAREIQDSIKESVHELLDQQIDMLGYRYTEIDGKQVQLYNVQKNEITNIIGSEFFFSGLRHKVDSIKSAEGVDIAWIEEANNVSKASWDKLRPTIRKPGSEIWLSFNPELPTDATYKMFVLDPPENSWVQYVTYKDNPWVTPEMMEEVRDTRARSEDDYLHIWLGKPKAALEGAIYAAQMRKASEEGRITNVPYDSQYPVNTFFDIGWRDFTAIWFIQKVGLSYHVIDYYENQFQDVAHYVKVLKDKPYIYGLHHLPFDAESKTKESKVDYATQFRDLIGGAYPQIIPRESEHLGISALRMVFPKLIFDEGKCEDGLMALRHFHYAKNDKNSTDEHPEFSRRPHSDWSAHACDALRYFAMSNCTPRERAKLQMPKKTNVINFNRGGNTAWMGR